MFLVAVVAMVVVVAAAAAAARGGMHYRVECTTTAADGAPIVIEVHPEWSPRGAKHFIELVEDAFFDNSPLFRVVPNFLVQFGISLNRAKQDYWYAPIGDDPKVELGGFKRGMVSYAGYGQNSRSTQLFIAYADSHSLGTQPWETPIGRVTSGMDVVDRFYSGYGDVAPFNQRGADQQRIQQAGGAEYLRDNFPEMDYIKQCRVVWSGELKDEVERRASATTALAAATIEAVVRVECK
eukprot:CAMPEP_0198315418 /NCGR_PEP_ID=MMETSP1450-20131203/5700_1 /TAXON_ID=753684 ORGANISM="Madagascaria erythrocladiodes, Strain CCMP3234" /NCGR_SAMPLE_ID=MMETSP1450 /ASSEMBLY_ACC=CAM_ASM_001115 /LENGTH=237 /DNA_ID=CAMNT_0044018533 /DNA_START=129 /DNA_END=840 /DNA_ORIENTATION=+